MRYSSWLFNFKFLKLDFLIILRHFRVFWFPRARFSYIDFWLIAVKTEVWHPQKSFWKKIDVFWLRSTEKMTQNLECKKCWFYFGAVVLLLRSYLRATFCWKFSGHLVHPKMTLPHWTFRSHAFGRNPSLLLAADYITVLFRAFLIYHNSYCLQKKGNLMLLNLCWITNFKAFSVNISKKSTCENRAWGYGKTGSKW